MDQIIDIVFSVAFVGIAVLTAGVMLTVNKIGTYLWSLRKAWLRKILRVLHAGVPVLPSICGAAFGLIPCWPVPAPFAELPANQKMWVMIVLGLIAGSVWERVWKTVKQALETRGVKVDIDDPPQAQ